jgi:ATP-binding cassette subfamily F protein uup
MNLITVENLSKQLGERQLFEGANLLVNEGDRIGLIGVNGSGKSTLLRILAGLEAPDEGNATMWGGVRVEYLAQEPLLDDEQTVLATVFASELPQMQLVRRYEEAVAALERSPNDPARQAALAQAGAEVDRMDAWAAEADAKAILTRLGIRDFEARIGHLSGGQRKRVALARALIDRADVLILDEPTNHIDAETVAWLETYLADTPGALVMVTHDRYFLDRVVTRIVELDRRRLVSYPGNYSHYLRLHAERQTQLAEAEQKRQNLLRRELEWLRRAPMARGTKQKARKQRAEELLQLRYDSGEETVSIALASRRLGKQALTAAGLTKRYDGQAVVDSISLQLEPGDRIGITGPNGAGKSTLLDILAGKTEPDAGIVRWGETVRIGYYDQASEDLDDHMRILEFVEEEAPLIRTKDGERVEAAKILEWFLFPRAMQWGRIGSLSGGERRRLYLLRTLIHQPNVLLLDEPTNDLDIQTLGVLEEFLDHFTGCLIVVSHDRYFLDRTVDYLCRMEDGRLGPRYPGPYAAYVELQEQAATELAAPQAPARAAVRSAESASPASRKLTWKEQRELEALEIHIADLEQQKNDLAESMASSGDDYLALQRLSTQLDDVEEQLSAALDRWFQLSELAEQMEGT